MNSVRATDRLYARLRKPKASPYLPESSFHHRARHISSARLDHAVLIEQINHIGLESFERSIGYFLDVFRSAIHSLHRPLPSAAGLNPNFVR